MDWIRGIGEERLGAQVEIVCHKIAGGCFLDRRLFAQGDFRLKLIRDLLGHFTFDREDVGQLSIKVSAQRWESLAALISCTFTRTASPLFCTLPSRMWATPSCLAISGRF